ncbi:MAG TPA: hypothetical protein VNA69_03310 [Thermoanaerobaculia bacterium]|nr:hypothetical protein [Thermoanaerobaculia bacterium]
MTAIETAASPSRKVVLVHGYSDRGASFAPWVKVLRERGFTTETIEVVTYKSLTNEVTIKDLAEGFERALVNRNITGDFDAIVHSTGILVVRAWLTANRGDRSRVKRLKHLIGFAPATWGSPLAHRGRGFLGSLFKGNKATDLENAPDFLEAGDLILDGLELASKFTWDLAHIDLFDKEPFYGANGGTPYPFIFCGNETYEGFRKFVNEPGTDGTVRFAGVSLDTCKFSLDLTKPNGHPMRFVPATPNAVEAPVIFADKKNHATILSKPEPEMAKLVVRALNVSNEKQFHDWLADARRWSTPPKKDDKEYQHFVIHLTDERGDPISDYHVELFAVSGGEAEPLPFDLELHPYERDKSFRSFHVDLKELKNVKGLWMRVTLSSGTILVAYKGISNEGFPVEPPPPRHDNESDEEYLLRLDARPTEINLDLSGYVAAKKKPLVFWPYTTTLIEIIVDREPLPFGDALARLCKWEDLKTLGV